jgi:predicted GIY-YIG superfamily endonuclease
MKGCYLIHFGAPVRGKRHYVGFSTDVNARFEKHMAGDGAVLTSEAVKQHVTLQLVRIWPDTTPDFEKQLKKNKNMKRLGMVCKEAADLSRCKEAADLSRRTAG